jgi:protein disulfide-isomerase A6
VQFGAVDCSEHKEFCIAAGVSALPGVKLYQWRAMRNPYKPRDPPAKVAVDYSGERSAKALSDFVTAQLPRDFIHNLTSAAPDWRDWAAVAPPGVLLFTDKAASTALYRALSLRFRGRLRFAQASAADAELAAAFGVSATPSLVVQLASGERVTYDGNLKANALTAFLEQYAAAAPPPDADAQQPAGAAAAASPATPLVLHNASQLSSAVLAVEPVAVVGFLGGSSDACAAEWEAWRAAARSVEAQGVVAAECAAGADWATPYVQGGDACVTVARFPFGAADKADADVELYEGVMDGRALGAWALESLPDFVRQITVADAEAYFSLDARSPKLILVTSKTETPLMFRTLAANFHGRIQFAVAHSSDPLAVRLKVERAPAVKVMLVPPGAVPGPDGAMPLMLQDYPGPLRYEHLAAFCGALADHAAGSDAAAGDTHAAGPAEVVALTDDAALREACEKRSALCVLAFLDSRAPSLPAQLAILQAAAARQAAGTPVQFAWVDASRHASAAAAFDVTTPPAAVVLSARRLRYALLRTAFSTGALSDLVSAVLAGRAPTAPLAALPRLVAEEAAPAAAAEEPPVEEEFDLSEIMDVSVDTTSREEQLRQAEASVRADQEARAAAATQAAEAAAKAAKAKSKKKSAKAKKKRAAAANTEL